MRECILAALSRKGVSGGEEWQSAKLHGTSEVDMERASDQGKSKERRFDRGSWVALVFALGVMAYNLFLGYAAWTTPTDGWIVDSYSSNGSDAQLNYLINVIGIPSDLRAGDRLTAVDGVPVADLMQASHQFYRQQAPNWEDGHILKYTVLREGGPVTLDVPIRRAGPVVSMLAEARLDELQHGGLIRAILQVVSSLLFFLIGWYVFLMRPRERAAQALLLLGVAFFNQALFAVNGTTALFYPFLSRSASTFLNYWTCIIIPSLIYLMLAFPRAKFPLDRFPRATVAALYLTWPVLFVIAYLPNLNDFRAYYALSLPIAISGLPVLIPVLILFGVSFARERDLAMRAQYKWMTLGVAGFIGIGILGWFLGALVTGGNAIVGYMSTLGWLLLPVSLAFAITRTRLFDIDVIVRRTLIYSTLTAALALSYFGAVVILQQVFRGLTGQGDDLALILSTLAIAALSVPLRGRVQQAIDRRFYRRKYDAGRVLETFGARVRDEVDLNKLTGHLVRVVEETIQPESVSLWLRSTEDGRRGTKA